MRPGLPELELQVVKVATAEGLECQLAWQPARPAHVGAKPSSCQLAAVHVRPAHAPTLPRQQGAADAAGTIVVRFWYYRRARRRLLQSTVDCACHHGIYRPMPSAALSSKLRASRTYPANVAGEAWPLCRMIAQSVFPAVAAAVISPARRL